MSSRLICVSLLILLSFSKSSSSGSADYDSVAFLSSRMDFFIDKIIRMLYIIKS